MRNPRSAKKSPPPLDAERLRNLALHYVGKYATTRGKLGMYLSRKIRERGWDGERQPDVAALIDDFAQSGYVNDAEFAEARSRSFVRRGYGKRRLDEDMRAARISEGDGRNAREHMDVSAFAAAENFARRKRIGPFASEPAALDQRQKQLQAFMRAGHSFDIARRFVHAQPNAELKDE